MLNYKYQLEKNAKKSKCPKCQNFNCYVRFINNETKEHLSYEFGRCDREINCGYFNKPNNQKLITNYTAPPQKIINTYSLIPSEIMFKSFKDYDNNTFIDSLNTVFKIEPEAIKRLIDSYCIGTSHKWSGATVFWQIDINNKVRAGKIMLYKNGHRVKNCINWIHREKEFQNFTLKQCFFGEHLLNTDKSKTVAIVESEKTAIICSHFLPDFIWLASGGLQNLTVELCKVLAYRNVALFPDLKAMDKWNEKAKNVFPSNCRISISQFLENIATDSARDKGFDLADYYETIGDDSYWIQQQKELNAEAEAQPIETKTTDYLGEVKSLIEYFDSFDIPEEPLKLKPHLTITNQKEFVKKELAILKTFSGGYAYNNAYDRLTQFKQHLN